MIVLIGKPFDCSPLRQVVLAVHAHTFGMYYPPQTMGTLFFFFFFNIPSGQSYSTFTRTPWKHPRVRMNLSPIEMSVRYASIRIAASCSTP